MVVYSSLIKYLKEGLDRSLLSIFNDTLRSEDIHIVLTVIKCITNGEGKQLLREASVQVRNLFMFVIVQVHFIYLIYLQKLIQL